MKEKVIKFFVIISVYIIIIRLYNFGALAIFFMDYYEWMNILLFFIVLAIAFFGIYQLITRKFNFRYLDGRVLGGIILSSLIFIGPLFEVNNINKTFSNAYNDGEDLLNKKLEMAQTKSYDEKVTGVTNILIKSSDNILDNFNVIKENNLNIYYGVGDYSESIQIIKDVMFSDKTKELSKYLSTFKDVEVNIIIVNEINEIYGVMDNNVAGYYDGLTGNIVLQTLSKYNSLDEYKGVIFHEYVHYALDKERKDILGDEYKLPKWFDEGLAEYLADKYYNNTNIGELYIVSPVGDITDDSKFNDANAFRYYEYSKCLVKYMFEQGGNNFIINLFEDMKITNDIYKSIENILGESFDEIKINML